MKVKTCPFCGDVLAEKVGPKYMFDMYLGTFQFDLCLGCGERLYHEDIMDAIDSARDKATAFIINDSTSSGDYWRPEVRDITANWTVDECWKNDSSGVD